MTLRLLYVSVGQRYGPERVAINLLRNMLTSQKLIVQGVVDKRISEALSLHHGKFIKTVNSPFDAAQHCYILYRNNRKGENQDE